MSFHHAPLVVVFTLVACGGERRDLGYGMGTGAAVGPGPIGGADGGGQGGAGAGACRPGQPVLVGEVVNARDLGGTPVEGGNMVACGALYRGAPLANLTSQGCAAFTRLGIRTVVDLRMPEERVSTPEAGCVQSGANIVLAPLPIPFNVSPQDYIADLNTTDSVAAVFRQLGDQAAYPIYFHCTWGRDRTGVLSAVVLLALGATREEIIREYLLSLAEVGAFPDSLMAVLDEVERRGGVDAYLTAAGVSASQVATLRALAITR